MRRSDAERFAISLVTLTLLRADYEVEESVRMDRGRIVDLIARKGLENGLETKFGIECKWVNTIDNLRLEQYRAQVSAMEQADMTIELAVVIGRGSKMLVSPGLYEKMVFDETKMTVEKL